MRLLAIALAAFLALGASIPRRRVPPPAGWQSVGTLGTGTSTSAGTTVAVTTSAAAEVGNVVICVGASDEAGSGTTDGTGNAQFTSMADTDAINSYTEAYEWCNMNNATVANGACVAVYWTEVTDEIESGDTITLTIASVTAKALTCWEFTIPGTATEISGENGLANDAADPGPMTLSSGVSAEHLFIRATACESNNTGYTKDTDYSGPFSNATANSGTGNTSMGARGEFRIANEATSAESDPGYIAADCASAMVAFDQ